DVAKRNFVIGFSHQKKTKTETNNAKGIQHTLDYLSQFNVALITLEATGGLEIPVAKALARAGYRLQQSHETQLDDIQQHIEMVDKLIAELDKDIDDQSKHFSDKADLISDIKGVGKNCVALEALVVRRRQLVDMRVAELNRLQQSHETQLDNIQQHIEILDKLIAELDKDIDDQSKHFSDKADLISDIKGVGKNCVAVMMSSLPELGKLSSKRIASLVGVIPHPQESGQWKESVGQN
ncbi:IS110 family transposase, partial [Glaesserella parasuis]|uniref:IS110 family transposase n=1 Tax=Glaesserella parasuis TaxID=738 RepID=UPI0003AC15ED